MPRRPYEQDISPDTLTRVEGTALQVQHNSDEEATVTVEEDGTVRLNSAPNWQVHVDPPNPNPPGIAVVEEWAVRLIEDADRRWGDGGIQERFYFVYPSTQEKAEYEAGLLFHGVDGDPERPPDPTARPANRYTLHVSRPHAWCRDASTGWSWQSAFNPPKPA
jgi:hypothetical protein